MNIIWLIGTLSWHLNLQSLAVHYLLVWYNLKSLMSCAFSGHLMLNCCTSLSISSFLLVKLPLTGRK